VEDALLWVRQALALSSAQLTQCGNGSLERRPHDVVATSWGGLAALASLCTDNAAPWASVGSLHLVAPGIFTSRGLLGRIASKALFDTLRGRGAFSGKFDLAIRPADFVASDELLAWVANDPARNQFVSARFLRTTAGLKKLVRERVGVSLSIPVYLHLPESDPVINLGRTEEFLGPVVRQVFRYPSAVHALVLQHPELLSRNIAAVVA
jgi:hypothetical protein